MQRAKVAVEQPAIVILRQPIAHRLDDALDRRSLRTRYPGALDEVGEPYRHRIAERLLPCRFVPTHLAMLPVGSLVEPAKARHLDRVHAPQRIAKLYEVWLLLMPAKRQRRERLAPGLLHDKVGAGEVCTAGVERDNMWGWDT